MERTQKIKEAKRHLQLIGLTCDYASSLASYGVKMDCRSHCPHAGHCMPVPGIRHPEPKAIGKGKW